MMIDFREDSSRIRAMMEQRVQSVTCNDPKTNFPAVSRIDMGYQCDQAGWVVLVFDRRPNAPADNAWQKHIARYKLDLPHWQSAYEAMGNETVTITLLDGTQLNLKEELEEEEYMAIFGNFLKDLLLNARGHGVFALLPKAAKCEMSVNEHDGMFHWSAGEDTEKKNLA